MNTLPPPDTTPRSPVVYVVDDDAGMRQTVIDVLALAGIAAEGFGSGASALALRGSGRPDLAVVDQRLPDTTGITLSARLKSEDPDLAVILLTGYASADSAIAAVGLVDDYLTKPVPPDDLVRSVRAGLERTQLRRENRHLVTRLQEMNCSLEATVADRTRDLRDAHRRALIARDITEQKQLRAAAELARRADDLEQANRNLESFTYSISHDLRAPLRALGGFSGVLLEDYGDVLGGDGRGYAERIQSASDHMAQLIDDLLNLSRVARAELHPRTVDLGAEVTRIAEDLQRAEPDRRVQFTIQRPVPAQADRTLIRTVLENLVGNAWKFTSHRDDALIEFGTTPAEDASLCCYVRDNGAGFDAAHAGRLFIPFQRLHTTSEFPGTGTGVGLAGVRRIVERHGGQVWAEGAVGEGATFYFTLDAKEIA